MSDDSRTNRRERCPRFAGGLPTPPRRSGRSADAVTLVAVTKYVSADVVRPLVAAGCRDLGESRPQQLWEKAAALADLPIRWHLIGHLQRNKVRRTLPLVAMIHSVDSPRLLAAIDEEWSGSGAAVACRPNPRQKRRQCNCRPNVSSRFPCCWK